jgi:hypothetical protein
MEFKKNANKLLDELKNTMEDIKEEFSKDIKILTINQIEILEMKSSISQINIWLK